VRGPGMKHRLECGYGVGHLQVKSMAGALHAEAVRCTFIGWPGS